MKVEEEVFLRPDQPDQLAELQLEEVETESESDTADSTASTFLESPSPARPEPLSPALCDRSIFEFEW